MIDSQFYALDGRYVGYIKWSGRHNAWVARLVHRDTGAAIVAMNHADRDEAHRWLETLAAQKVREEAGHAAHV